MIDSTVEERGRIVIPKEIRDELNLHGGQTVKVETDGEKIIISKKKSYEQFKELKGCVKKSDIDPMDVKNIWSA